METAQVSEAKGERGIRGRTSCHREEVCARAGREVLIPMKVFHGLLPSLQIQFKSSSVTKQIQAFLVHLQWTCLFFRVLLHVLGNDIRHTLPSWPRQSIWSGGKRLVLESFVMRLWRFHNPSLDGLFFAIVFAPAQIANVFDNETKLKNFKLV